MIRFSVLWAEITMTGIHRSERCLRNSQTCQKPSPSVMPQVQRNQIDFFSPHQLQCRTATVGLQTHGAPIF